MSQAIRCRLCINTCADYLSLYDDCDRCKGVLYEVTVKYFPSKVLALITGSQLTGMCLKCWRQISEFHIFHNAILSAQAELSTHQDKLVALPAEVAVSGQEAALGNTHDSGTCDGVTVNVKEQLKIIDAYNDNSTITIKAGDESTFTGDSVIVKEELVIIDEHSGNTRVMESSDGSTFNGIGVIVKEELEIIDIHDNDNSAITIKTGDGSTFTGDNVIVKKKIEIIDDHNDNGTIKIKTGDGSTFTGGDVVVKEELDIIDDHNDNTRTIESVDGSTFKGGGVIAKEVLEIIDVHDDNNTLAVQSEDGAIPGTSHQVIHQEEMCVSGPDSSQNDDSNTSYNDIDSLYEDYDDNDDDDDDDDGDDDDDDDPLAVFTGEEFNNARGKAPPSLSDLDSITLNSYGETSSTASETETKQMPVADRGQPVRKTAAPGNISTNKAIGRTSTKQHDDYIAKWRAVLDCPLCNDLVDNFSLLREHFKSKHPQERCYILCCERQFFVRTTLLDHIRFHIDPNVLECDICGRKYGSVKNVKKHKLRKHQDPNAAAQKPRGNITKKQFDDIIARWKPNLVCGLCKDSLPSGSMLQRHFRAVHPQETFYVECCGEKLEQMWQAADHMQSHIDPNAFKCKLCGKQHASSRHLNRHMYFAHAKAVGGGTPPVKINYKCSHCEKSFFSETILQEHVAMHTGKLLYKCLYCPERFRYRSLLYKHLKTKHPKGWAEKKHVRRLYKQMEINQ